MKCPLLWLYHITNLAGVLGVEHTLPLRQSNNGVTKKEGSDQCFWVAPYIFSC